MKCTRNLIWYLILGGMLGSSVYAGHIPIQQT